MNNTQYAAQAMDLVNDDQISDYIETLFSSVFWKPHHFIVLRGIPEKGSYGDRHPQPETETCQPGLEDNSVQDEVLIDVVKRKALEWGAKGYATFVIPNVLKSSEGKSKDVELMTAVVVDIDTGDTNAKARWCVDNIGMPTMAVESGGRTKDGTAKLHLYWVFDEPETDVHAVVEARHLVAEKVGGDLQFGRGEPGNPLGRAHQCIRVGGSVHGKGGVLNPARVVHSSGPRYSFLELSHKIANAPHSPWRTEAKATPTFEFGIEQYQKPDWREIGDVYEGGEGDLTRWAALGKMIGGYIGQARAQTITLEQAKEASRNWMRDHMKATDGSPKPFPEGRFEHEWHRLLALDAKNNGPLLVRETVQPLVLSESLGLREWATHRWAGPVPPERHFLVEGLVLRDKPHLLVAEGGAGKTFSVLDLALKVATFEDGDDVTWWGQKVVSGGTVVMLTTEDDSDELHIRLASIDPDGRRFTAGDRLIVAPLVNMGGAFPLGERDKATGTAVQSVRWRQMLEEIEKLPNVRLVIVDTLNTTLHGEENNSTVVNEYVRMLSPICGKIGSALIVTHHIRKTDTRFPIKTPDDMFNAIRGSSALPAAFRAVLGVWHCYDFTKRMSAMGLSPEPKQLWRMGVLKANNPDMVRGVRFLLRQGNGLLEDATATAANAIAGMGAQREAWLYAAVEAAAKAGLPYTGGKKDAATGLYERRGELHSCLREEGFGRTGLPALMESMISRRALVLRQCKWLDAKGRRIGKPTLDVPDGPYTQENPEPVDSMDPYKAPEWERDYRFDEVEGVVVPMDAPRLIYGRADDDAQTGEIQ